jgi:hypothetical protein
MNEYTRYSNSPVEPSLFFVSFPSSVSVLSPSLGSSRATASMYQTQNTYCYCYCTPAQRVSLTVLTRCRHSRLTVKTLGTAVARANM